MINPFKWIVGEISKLMQPDYGQYGWGVNAYNTPYSLNTSRVNYQ